MDTPPGTGTTGAQRLVAGRYALLAPLGTGGMGTVWRARDQVLGREVAVKEVVPPRGLSDADRDVLFERTRREARAAARLDHPSAVTVFDVVEDDGHPFLVMELVPARTLADVVRSDGPLSPRVAAQVGLAVLGALEAAHRRGIVHRDVKPGNVLLGGDRARPGRVVLTDFGIATSAGDSSITSTGLLLGSPSYIAPERARGQSPGPASDLWSLGATLFTAVEGRPPFDAGDPLSTLTAVVMGEHAPFVAAAALEPVLSGLLESDPAERLDAETTRVMLEQVLRGPDGPLPAPRPASGPEPSTAARSGPPSPGPAARDEKRNGRPAPRTAAAPQRSAPTQRSPRRRVVAVLLTALVLLGAAAAGGLLLLRQHDGTTSAPGTPASPGSTASPAFTAARPTAVPADWVAYTDPSQRWTVFTPPGYTVSDRGQLKQLRDESTRFTLRVDSTSPRTSALQSWQAFSPVLAQQLGSYQQLRLEPVQFRGWDAADLEFTYSDSGADLHVVDRTFTVGGRSYSLWWQTNADRFASSLPQFEQIAATFVPAG